MKVSEAIDRLEVGDTVWAKLKVYKIDYSEFPLGASGESTSVCWFNGEQEISLAEPQAEKVEVELTRSQADFMKEHENDSLYKLMRASIPEYEELFARARLNGYTVNPKRWVVKYANGKYFVGLAYGSGIECLDKITAKTKEHAYPFDDKSKAEAVATLVEGSVEEV